MNEQEILESKLEGNKLIAEFMGNPLLYDGVGNKLMISSWIDKNFKVYNYNSDWNLLMSVVDKIEILPDVMDFSIGTNYVSIEMKDNSTFGYTIFSGEKKEYVAYKTVIQFIKWYNKQ